jgi:integrase
MFFKRIPQAQIVKDFLTKAEISKIIKTRWHNRLKEAFIMECLTAIAYQELKNLQWKDINTDEYCVTVKRRKTGVIISNPLNKEIIEMLGIPGDRSDLVFPELSSQKTYNNNIKRLMLKAGIKKHITSHSGRASCIINLISGAGGLYSAKNFAGHTDLKTTLRYAQFSAEMKRDAGNDLLKGIEFPKNS